MNRCMLQQNQVIHFRTPANLRRSSLFRSVLMTVPLAIGGTADVLAQPASGERRVQLEEVVVTASRREESMQDVASSIAVISAGTLESRGITNFEDVKTAVAGLHLEAHSNMTSAQVRIRGVGDSPNSGVDPSVGILVDGVYQLRGGAAFTELMDIERIEVLRGPQGTLFGKNTTAGVIHIHTRNPDTQEFAGKLQGVVGNYDARELRGTVNIPLIDDQLAVRISGFTTQRDGHSKNLFLNKDSQTDDKEGGRAKLLWQATDNLDVLWSSEILKQEGRLDQGLIQYGRNNVASIMSGQPWQNLAAALGRTLPDVRMGRTAHNTREFEDEVERHVLTLNWSLPAHTLQSITAYEKIESSITSDRDRTPLELSYSVNEPVTETRSQEFLLSSDGDSSWSYIVGAFYQEEELSSITHLINGPDLIALGGSPGTTLSVTARDNRTAAGFVNLTYELSDHWSVVGGVRYTSDKKEDMGLIGLSNGAIVISEQDGTFNEWTYTAKLRYHFDDRSMAYISIDRGFKSGGFNRQDTQCLLGNLSRCLSPDRLSYDPEMTDSIEVGLKSEWLDNRIRFNGALFYQTYDDYQVRESIPAEVAILVTNAAEVESQGLELDLTAAVTNNLQINGSLAWISTRYDKFTQAPCATPASARCMDGRQDLSGRQLDNAPKLMGNIGVEYRAMLPVVDSLEWFARVDASYRSSTNLDVTQSVETEQGAYTLYSARVGLEPMDGQWRMTLWGRNLGDKSYATVASHDVGGVTQLQGMPRTYGLTLDWNF